MLEDGPDALQFLDDCFTEVGGMRTLRLYDNLTAAAMTLSLGVMSGFMIYLCLWNNVAKICVALVYFIHIIHEQ